MKISLGLKVVLLPRRCGRSSVSGVQHLGEFERQFDALFGVETRVTVGLIVELKMLVEKLAAATGAFRYILAGEFQVDAARDRPFRLVDLEEVPDLSQDFLEFPGLLPEFAGVGVAVHRVAAPDQLETLLFHFGGEPWQMILDDPGPEAGDQGQPARFIIRVEAEDDVFDLIEIVIRADLDADRVSHPAQKFDVGTLRLAGPIADPEHVGTAVVPSAGDRIPAGQRLLIAEEQGFTGGVKDQLV